LETALGYDRTAERGKRLLGSFLKNKRMGRNRRQSEPLQQGAEQMIHIEHRSGVKSAVLTLLALAPACVFSAGLASNSAWAQQTRRQLHAPPQELADPRKPGGATEQPPAPALTPVALPPSDGGAGNGPLGSTLAACDKLVESSEALALPGAKGEIKLDRCYRGRDHLVCSLSVLLKEAKALLQDYSKIIEANYPNVGDVKGVCGIRPDNLATDLQNASAFTARFKALKAEYDARMSCANRIEQSLRDVSLPDMARAPDILKSMIDAIQGDMKGVATAQAQVSELAEKIDFSQKAMVTIRKIHRTMCMSGQHAAQAVGEHGTGGR
jgi:hypothetical protein